MCQSMVDIQSAAAEIRRGKKKKKEGRRTNHSMKIYMVSLLHRATINNVKRARHYVFLGAHDVSCRIIAFCIQTTQISSSVVLNYKLVLLTKCK